MPRFHPPLAEWLRVHHGVVAHQQLLGLGLTLGQIRALLDCGAFIVVHEGVYRHAVWPDTFLSQCVAACAADPGVVVSCGGAALLWQFRRCRGAGFHVLCEGSTKRLSGGPFLHRTSDLPAHHVHVRSDGIRVTSPARTAFDLARHLRDLDLESVMEQGIDRGQFDVAALQRISCELCQPGRAGSTRFRRVLASRPAWRRPADSHPELVMRDALGQIGIHLQTQVVVDLGGGVIIHPDLGDPDGRFYVEIDDHEWHGNREAIQRDRQRDRRIRLLGGRIERVGTNEIATDLARTVREVEAAYRQHCGYPVLRPAKPDGSWS